jgi:Flp pilus assembly protein TadD
MASRSKKKFPLAPKSRPVASEERPGLLTQGAESTTRLQGLTLIAVALWIFSPILRGDWLWDDDKYILHNDLIHDPAGWWKVLVKPDGLGNYDPLTSLVRWLQWQVWGDNTLGYHLTSVGLHLASAFLIWRLFSRLRIPCAWLGALIFTVHPLMVESVAWIAELKNTLSLPPLLLAMLAFLNYEEKGRPADYLQALGWFVVAMLAKTTGMMLPVVLLGYAWWKQGKICANELKASVPFFAVALVAGLVSLSPHVDPGNQAEIVATGGAVVRLASIGWAALFLLGKTLIPIGLMPAYPGNAVATPGLVDLVPWLVLIGALGLCWSMRKTWGLPAIAGLGFFLVNLVPVFGYIAMNYATMIWSMDHLVYLPIIGLIGLAAAGTGLMARHLPPPARPVRLGVAAVVVGLLAWTAHGYAEMFSDEETLWSYAVRLEPHLFLAQENLGKALLLENRGEEAKPHLEEVLRLQPNRAPSHYNLGKALVQMGQFDEGMAEYRQALAIDPTDAEIENNWGIALLQSGKIPEAIGHFEAAIRLKPGYALAYDNLGGALALSGRNQEAVDRFTQALKLMPGSADAHDNMGNALLKLDRNDEAKTNFQQALQIDPDDAKAKKGLEKLQDTPK